MTLDMMTFRAMTNDDRPDAFRLLKEFLDSNQFYLANSSAYGLKGETALATALALFVRRPEFGFVWMAYDGSDAIACAIVSYAISTAVGGVVAKLEDVVVAPARRRHGVGRALVEALASELQSMRIARIDSQAHVDDAPTRAFYEKLGFTDLHEVRLALVL